MKKNYRKERVSHKFTCLKLINNSSLTTRYLVLVSFILSLYRRLINLLSSLASMNLMGQYFLATNFQCVDEADRRLSGRRHPLFIIFSLLYIYIAPNNGPRSYDVNHSSINFRQASYDINNKLFSQLPIEKERRNFIHQGGRIAHMETVSSEYNNSGNRGSIPAHNLVPYKTKWSNSFWSKNFRNLSMEVLSVVVPTGMSMCIHEPSISKSNNGSRILASTSQSFLWQPITTAIFRQYYFSGVTSRA